MKVLLFRAWTPSPVTAAFSDLSRRGVGGTELQLLLHARGLRDLGHEVVIVGVTKETRIEEDILFEGSLSPETSRRAIANRHLDARLALLSATDELQPLRSLLPNAVLAQVCQNGPALKHRDLIDLYAFVGEGQLAKYGARYRRLRHRFLLLPNVVPWETYYRHVLPQEPAHQVLWLGGFTKPGLRRWGRAMASLMRDDRQLMWVLCGPSYVPTTGGELPDALAGIPLPSERVIAKNLPLPALGEEIARSAVVVASLAGEDGPVSYLDGHALGVPVLSANDIVGAHANPSGTGFRCLTAHDCEEGLRYLMANPDRRHELGSVGREFVIARHTERQQLAALRVLVQMVKLMDDSAARPLLARVARSDRRYPMSYWWERLEIKVAVPQSRRKRCIDV